MRVNKFISGASWLVSNSAVFCAAANKNIYSCSHKFTKGKEKTGNVGSIK
jgi:hypothetical protein